MIISFAWKRPTCARMRARAWGRWMRIGRLWPTAPSRGTLPRRSWNWLTLGWATHCAGSAIMPRRHKPTSRRHGSAGVGPELKVRTLLAAGECHDMPVERQLAMDYQAAIDAGPDTSRADTARKRLRSPYRGN